MEFPVTAQQVRQTVIDHGITHLTVSTEEVHAWLRSIADAHGLKGQAVVAIQFTWEELDASQPAPGNMHTEVRSGIPGLSVMVSNSRVPS